MIKTVNLQDIAKYERARKGKRYPEGCSIIQVSATTGEVQYLENNQEVEGKYVVIIPHKENNARYINIVIEKNMAEFINKYKSGLNIQMADIGRFPIQLHSLAKQVEIVRITEKIEAEMKIAEKETEIVKELKKTMLDEMLI